MCLCYAPPISSWDQLPIPLTGGKNIKLSSSALATQNEIKTQDARKEAQMPQVYRSNQPPALGGSNPDCLEGGVVAASALQQGDKARGDRPRSRGAGPSPTHSSWVDPGRANVLTFFSTQRDKGKIFFLKPIAQACGGKNDQGH